MDIFEKQYLKGSGFCGECGDAIHPPKGLESKLGKCPYSGSHPEKPKALKPNTGKTIL